MTVLVCDVEQGPRESDIVLPSSDVVWLLEAIGHLLTAHCLIQM